MLGGAVQPLMRIGWTVNYEIFFYILYALAIKVNKRYRNVIVSIMIFVITLFGMNYKTRFIPIDYYTSPFLLEFVFGILAYYGYNAFTKISNKMHYKKMMQLILMISIILLVIAMYQFCDISLYSEMNRVIYWGIPSSILVLLVCISDSYFTFPEWLCEIGNLSFSIYLLHYYIVQFAGRKLFDFTTLTIQSAFGIIICTLFIILLSKIANDLIEKKLYRFLYSEFTR